ncbi:hypothetical protein [Mesorhizobium sp.]|uniref:hypothetical protein n=1 Tax=Mesorhizobium sp. TaxID=1871066 RepID=UPI00120E6623|nr:hypothetical protein [Mesorhizobium sp.]TIO04973.1 MAG: hypothetical protein E5X88_29655 [Mesorhizobium sp.]TIO36968.1 MAG: hypothetical protein E5X89_02960 [Mesorhizobium sp.]TIP11393.1 MAG: hypothetical protein E5X73_17445 [Mesorhizobium sp.]
MTDYRCSSQPARACGEFLVPIEKCKRIGIDDLVRSPAAAADHARKLDVSAGNFLYLRWFWGRGSSV